jgi:hypothetical protein
VVGQARQPLRLGAPLLPLALPPMQQQQQQQLWPLPQLDVLPSALAQQQAQDALLAQPLQQALLEVLQQMQAPQAPQPQPLALPPLPQQLSFAVSLLEQEVATVSLRLRVRC